MSEKLIKKSMETIGRMSPEELEKTLLPTLIELHTYGLEQALQETPGLLQLIIDKLLEMNPAKLICKTPEISERFMELLWEGIGKMTVQSDPLKPLLEKTRDINVNIEASDSPFRGHFKILNGTLSGGSAFFHFKDEDYRLMGTTKVLLELLTGQLALGFSNPGVQTAGHSGFAAFVAPIVKGVAALIKSGRLD